MKCMVFSLIDKRCETRKRPSKIGDAVELSNGEACAFSGEKLTGRLRRAIVVSVSSNGLFIEGFEALSDPRKLIWQRWWCAVGNP